MVASRMERSEGKGSTDLVYLEDIVVSLSPVSRKVGRAFGALKFGRTNFEGNLIARSEKIRKAKV